MVANFISELRKHIYFVAETKGDMVTLETPKNRRNKGSLCNCAFQSYKQR